MPKSQILTKSIIVLLTARGQSNMLKDEITYHAVLEDAKACKKQLQCNHALKLNLADALGLDLDFDVDPEEKVMFNVLREVKAASRASKECMQPSKDQQEVSYDWKYNFESNSLDLYLE